jgi:hypothetical protein
MSDQRRLYSELDDIEKAIVRASLSKERVAQGEVIDQLSDDFDEEQIKEAIGRLRSENRLFRIGNKSEFVMIERDLF